MNTKTTKFLAVLAVFAMAFAAFAVAIPAETNEADADPTPLQPINSQTVDVPTAEQKVIDLTADGAKNKILKSGIEFTIDYTKGSDTLVLYLLEGATITIEIPTEGTEATLTHSILFGTATGEGTEAKPWMHGSASEVKFTGSIDTKYTVTNNKGVIEIVSKSTKLTQDQIQIVDKSSGEGAWGGVLSADNVVIKENGKYETVFAAANYGIGIASATTIVNNKITMTIATATLTVNGIVKLNSGIEIQKAPANAEVTLQLVSSNGAKMTGEFTLLDNKISADACNANFTVAIDSNGKVTQTVAKVSAGQLTLVKGDFKATEGTTAENVAVEAKATLNILSEATLTVSAGNTLQINGALYLSGKLVSSETNSAANLLVGTDNTKAIFKTRIGATMTGINFAALSQGSVDITTVLNDVGLAGQIESSNSYTASQVVTLLGDLTITNKATITIHGYLVVPAGYTLKIDDGSALIVDGIFSESEVYGEIEVSNDSALFVKLDKSFDIYGELNTNAGNGKYASLNILDKLTAKSGSTLNLAGATFVNAVAATDTTPALNGEFTVEDGATAYISGPIKTGVNGNALAPREIKNAGTIVFDGAKLMSMSSNDVTGFITVAEKTAVEDTVAIVKMTANGASVDIEDLVFDVAGQSNYFLVTDAGIKGSAATDCPTAEYYNTVKIQPTASTLGISGLEIGEKASTTIVKNKTYTKNNMWISGEVAKTGTTEAQQDVENINITVTQGLAATATEKKYGSFSIEDELDLLTNVNLTFDDSAEKVTVNGDVTVENGAKFVASKVGSITVKGSIDSYEALTAPTYGACIGAQFKADTHSFVITTVPAAMTFAAVQEGKVTVTVYGENTVSENMYITANVKMLGGSIVIAKDVTVEVIEGASVATAFTVNGTLYANVEKNITGTVKADVKVTDGVAAKWTSLANALASAEAGDIILITNSSLTISDSITIPVDVTVVIPDGTTTEISANKTLTVNGTLICDATSITLDTAKTAKIVVNGLARFIGNTPAKIYDDYKIADAYYTEDNYVYVSNLVLASQSDVDAISIYGKVSESKTVEITGQVITLETDATLKVSDLTLVEAAAIDATLGKLSGTVAVTGLDGANAGVMAFTDYHGEVAIVLYSLVPTAVIDEITGTVSIVSGAVTIVKDDDSEIAGTLNILPGAEFFIPYGETVALANVTNTGEIHVLGTLNIDSEKFINAGVIDVMYNDVDTHKGILNVDKIEMSVGSIIVDDGAEFNLNGNLTLGYAATSVDGVAAIEGIVNIDSGKYIIAYANADVSEMIVNPNADGASTAKTTAFYINDELYMTLIAGSTNDITYLSVIEGLTFAIEELDETQLATLKTSAGWGIKDTDTIGTYDELSAEIDYKLIAIQASWVKGLSLYVDGVRISTPGDLKLSVGVHLVSATVDAGYACDNMGITFNGVAVTPAGIFVEVDDTGSVLAVTGDVYIPEPEPVTPEEKSEWTITTILLVILVILIAIMAVIVALRLNRS